MKDKTKEIILKTNIVFGFTFLVLPVLFIVLGSMFTEYTHFFGVLIKIDGILFLLSGVSFLILIFFVKFKLQSYKAEVRKYSYNNYQSFIEDFSHKVEKHKYYRYLHSVETGDFNYEIFVRRKFWLLESFYIINICELTKENLELVYMKFDENIKKIYNKETINDWISVIMIICVEKDSTTFREFTNSNIAQNFKFFQLPVGVFLKERQLYIARQKDGYAVRKYKKLRKHFLQIYNGD